MDNIREEYAFFAPLGYFLNDCAFGFLYFTNGCSLEGFSLLSSVFTLECQVLLCCYAEKASSDEIAVVIPPWLASFNLPPMEISVDFDPPCWGEVPAPFQDSLLCVWYRLRGRTC